VALSRAALAQPRIHILDEATASVDTRTESVIQVGLEELLANRSSLLIAHRLSTIRGADVLAVMIDGRIVEKGRHAKLLATGGVCSKLHAQQLGGLIADPEQRGSDNAYRSQGGDR
jgi:ATP-binding cassette subfamily B protein